MTALTAGPFTQQESTTQYIGRFRRELVAEGFGPDEAFQIVMSALTPDFWETEAGR